MKKILVPVDFSASSRLALQIALSLGETFGASIRVLNVWDVPTYLRPDLTVWVGEVSTTLVDYTRAEAERAMEKFLTDEKLNGRANLTSELASGEPYPTILAKAKEGGFDLIAMGTHGRVGLSRLVLGSVAERVVRHSTCPVLTVRAPDTKA